MKPNPPIDSRNSHPSSNVLTARGRPDEAIAHFRKALDIRPDDADTHYNLGWALAATGRSEEALAQYRQALGIRSRFAKAMNSLAELLATCPDPPLRDGASAMKFARQANQLCGGKSPEVLRSLAAAQAETGRFDEATATARAALELAEQ
jgi:Flp pilus assembly protein TadD